MEIRLSSTKFSFDVGDAAVWFGSDEPSTPDIRSSRLVDGRIHIDRVTIDSITICLSNVTVQSGDGRRHRIPMCFLKGEIQRDDLAVGYAYVSVDPRAVVRVIVSQTVFTDGAPVTVGIASEDGTIEYPVAATEDLEFLLAPGRHRAFIRGGNPDDAVSFDLAADSEPQDVLLGK